ncbi:hypothetical protein HN832_03845 [archaeon]|jgi:hypothetical protein|nr:hypothetical protein [archaeon]MBT4373473.1 hypothetical protein [archaeon]MBT4531921.1 hypothetical protein [archaeon]MBT7001588.1 hypothetical protein [archaeon]MBT7282520.1 hypothetical protein [archaeon]
MQEANNILKILRETEGAFKKKDAMKLKELSNQMIHTSSRTQDADNISVAVIVYSLGKIIERERYRNYLGYKNLEKMILFSLKKSIQNIQKDDLKDFRKNLENIRKQISKLSGKLKKYIKEVFDKAKVNKASRIYEHGVSMERTAKLLGISMWDLASYAGQTGIADVKEAKTMSAKERIKLMEGLFV